MQIGKLYQIKKYYWMVYPSKETATATAVAAGDVVGVAADAAYWSKYYNCNVTYISPNSIFCLIEQYGKYLKVLTTNGEIGWMIYPENENWAKGTIEEVKQ